MKLDLKRVSWRTTGIVVLGLALIASLSLNFVVLHPTAKATALATRHGTIAAGKSTIKLTATGQVDWAKLPKGAVGPATTVQAKQVVTTIDRMTPSQRAAYVKAVTSGKIKSPFAPTQAVPSTVKKTSVPSPNFDACGYTNLPCKTYGFSGMSYSATTGGWIPPDQALAVNSSQVMEGVNNAIAVYTFNGAAIYGPTSSATFFASIIHGSDTLTDPQMFWDASRNHFIFMEAEVATNSSNGDISDYYDIAVSKAQSPNLAPSNWYLYQFNTNVTVGGSADFCDYPTMGSDYWGLWLDCVAFDPTGTTFLGNAVFALNKTALYANTPASVNLHFWTQIPTGISNGSGGFEPAFRLSSVNEDGTPDAEFLIATDAGYGGPNTDLTTVAFTDTRAIAAGGTPKLSYVITTLPISYTDPIGAAQPGTTAQIDPGSGTKQIEYKGGNLYFALVTAVNSGTHDGVYWAEVQPQLSGLDPANPQNQVVANTLVRQAAIFAFSNADVYMPSMEGSSEDDEVLSFNISSSTIFPSIIYTARRATDPLNSIGDVNNYAFAVVGTHSNDSGRWGDYSACGLATNETSRGLIFCAGEYGGPTAGLGSPGWDTYIYGLRVE